MNMHQAMTQIQAQQFAPIYLVTGTEAHLMDCFEAELKRQYLTDADDTLNVVTFDMETTEIQDAVMEANTVSFFSERRIIIVKKPYFLTGENKRNGLNHQVDTLFDYMAAPAEDVLFVILANYESLDGRKKIVKQLKKQTTVVDATPMKGNQVRDYIQELVKEAGKKIQRKALSLFLERTNYALTPAVNEIEKLLLFIGDEEMITKQAVETLVTPTLDDNIFHLTDYMMKKAPQKALQLYRELIAQKQQPLAILALLQSNFRLYTQITQLQKVGYNQGSMAKEIRAHPYRVKMAAQQMQAYPEGRLVAGYMQLVELENEIKTGHVEQNLGIEWFILNFCQTAA